MEQVSPYNLVKRLEGELIGHLAPIDLLDLPIKERAVIQHIRRDLADVRLDIRDYELSETRQEQLNNSQAAKKRLRQINHHILLASETNVFGPVDVAQLTARVEQIIINLQ